MLKENDVAKVAIEVLLSQQESRINQLKEILGINGLALQFIPEEMK